MISDEAPPVTTAPTMSAGRMLHSSTVVVPNSLHQAENRFTAEVERLDDGASQSRAALPWGLSVASLSTKGGARLLSAAVSPAVIAAMLFASTTWASTGQRVALVIGNASYQHVTALANPLYDAADIGATLGRLGFTVTIVENVVRAELWKGLLWLEHELRHHHLPGFILDAVAVLGLRRLAAPAHDGRHFH